jgi:hypothetical protein
MLKTTLAIVVLTVLAARLPAAYAGEAPTNPKPAALATAPGTPATTVKSLGAHSAEESHNWALDEDEGAVLGLFGSNSSGQLVQGTHGTIDDTAEAAEPSDNPGR